MALFTTARARRWVQSLIPNPDDRWFFSDSPHPDEHPDRLVVVSLRPGAGLAMEGLIDRPNLQLWVRGLQDDYDATEEFALTADRALTFESFPMEFEGVYISQVQRIGGRPDTPMPDGDDGRRFILTSNYNVSVSTDI